MSGVLHEASELGFEAYGLRINTASSQECGERPSQKTHRLGITGRDLEVMLDGVRDGHEGALVVSLHLGDGTVDPSYLAQRRFIDVWELFPHGPERT